MKISASKKQLAKIISENGGWRDGAKFAAQDQEHCGKQKVISFYINEKPWFRGGTFWRGNGVHDDRIETGELVRGWHQTLLSRDEYFHLYPAPDADRWIEWKGGERPVEQGVLVDVRYEGGGHEIYRIPADSQRWSHMGYPADIVAYRLHKPEFEVEKSKPERVVIEQKPTIEQLAADYRAKLAIARQAQEEADSRRAEAEAALEKLYNAGLDIGIDIAIASDDDDLVVTDWRDLKVGDEIATTLGRKLTVTGLRQHDESWPIDADDEDGCEWCVSAHDWRFIRRPSKEANHA